MRSGGRGSILVLNTGFYVSNQKPLPALSESLQMTLLLVIYSDTTMTWIDSKMVCFRSSNISMNIEKFSGLVVLNPKLSPLVDSKERNVSTSQIGGWLWHYLSSSPFCLLGASLLLSKLFGITRCTLSMMWWKFFKYVTLCYLRENFVSYVFHCTELPVKNYKF